MEVTLNALIAALVSAKEKTNCGGDATVYIGHSDGSGVVEPGLCLCAEETYKGTNIPLFAISSSNDDNLDAIITVNTNLKHDREYADAHEHDEY